MSLDATRWAWMQQGLRPIQKLVLLALADRADASNKAFPSYETLKHDTGADRKTIWKALKELEAKGIIQDTGERRGHTGKVVVWQLVGVELREQFQKRNHSKNGTVPFFPANSSKNGTTKQFQKRNIEPTNIEPTKEPPPHTEVVNTTKGGENETEVERGGGDFSGEGEKEELPAQPSKPEPKQESGEGLTREDALIYPDKLDADEKRLAQKLIETAPADQRQDILDELAGLIEAGQIRKSHLSVLRGLVRRAQDGEFAPEMALGVQRARKAKKSAEMRREAARRAALVQHGAPTTSKEAFQVMKQALGQR